MNPQPPVNPEFYDQPELRRVLAEHNIGALYRALTVAGVAQRQIAILTGQSQSEVSEILKGRKVIAYDLLARIADGLSIPREFMGLSYGDDSTYRGGVTDADPEGDDEMLRRQFSHLLAVAAAATFGGAVPGVGKLADQLTAPRVLPTPPARIGKTDVSLIGQCGRQISATARDHGGQGHASARFLEWAEQYLHADCAEPVRRELLTTLSRIHTVTAWCCHDSGAVGRALWHFGRAVELGTEGGDSFAAAYAMRHAAMMLVDRDEPDRALKLAQLATLRLADMPRSDQRVPVLRGECHVVAALALGELHTDRDALRELSAARDGWSPPTAHARGCMDLDGAHAQLLLGHLDTAQAMAASAAETLTESGHRREGVLADLALARVHVLSGEPRGLTLAARAVDEVSASPSAVARQCWLPPLADALDRRREPDARDLARQARQLATA